MSFETGYFHAKARELKTGYFSEKARGFQLRGATASEALCPLCADSGHPPIRRGRWTTLLDSQLGQLAVSSSFLLEHIVGGIKMFRHVPVVDESPR